MDPLKLIGLSAENNKLTRENAELRAELAKRLNHTAELELLRQRVTELADENARLREWKIGYGRRTKQRKALRQV
jgi:predicted nuclease with TOPRIM domain